MPSNRMNDPNFDPTTNPHQRLRDAKVAQIRKSEQEAAQRKLQVVEAPKRTVSAGGVVLDPVTAEMREKIEAERQAKKKAPVAAAPLSPEDAEQIVMTLVEAFENQHRDVFHAVPGSKFNASQFIHFHLAQVSKGLALWTPTSMDKSFQYLLANGYFEKPTRMRGEPAAKVVALWKAPAAPPETVTQAEALLRNRTEISAEENARLRNMPLSELKKQARSTFKEDPSGKITRI